VFPDARNLVHTCTMSAAVVVQGRFGAVCLALWSRVSPWFEPSLFAALIPLLICGS
ncbi:hypothetical protein Dimus_005653, partial [Dionaea muscipula]